MFKLSELGTTGKGTHLHLSYTVGNNRKRNTSNHSPFPAEREIAFVLMSCFGPSWFARIALVIFRVPFAVPGVFTLYTRTMFHIWQDAEIRFEPELLRLQQWATHIPKMLSIVSLTAVQLIVRFEVPEIMNKLTKNQIFISFLIKLVHVHLLIYVHVYHLRVYCIRTCTICWWC